MTITPYTHLVSLVVQRFPTLPNPAVCLTVMSVGSGVSKVVFGILAERTPLTFIHLNQISWVIYGLGLTLVPIVFDKVCLACNERVQLSYGVCIA